MNLSFNNFTLLGERVSSIEGHEFPKLSIDEYLCEACKEIDGTEYTLYKTDEEELNSLFNSSNKPLVGIAIYISANNCKKLTSSKPGTDRYDRYIHDIYKHYLYESNIYPSVFIDNKRVDNSLFYK